MNASCIKSVLSNEAAQRQALGSGVAFIVSYAVTALSMAMLTTFLWWLVAAIVSMAAGVACGYVAGSYAMTSGYDHAVNASASVLKFFRAVKAKAA
jgi:hypothetical protein